MNTSPASRFYTSIYAFAVLALLVTVAPAWSDDGSGEQVQPIKTVIKKTRYIEPAALTDVLRLFEVEMVVKPEFDSIILRGTAEDLDTAIKVIESLDEPGYASSNIELIIHILAASDETQAADGLPEELDKIVDQLTSLFGYPGFRLLETTFLRATDGGRGLLKGGLKTKSDRPADYTLGFDRVKRASNHPDDPQILRFKNLNFQYQVGGHTAMLGTDLELPVGRWVVLGKATPSGLSEALVLIAKAQIDDFSKAGDE